MEDKKNNQVINEPERGDRSTLNQYQQSSIIKAIGVGGGGINAVNQMFFTLRTSTMLSSTQIVSNSIGRLYLTVCF